MRYAALLILMLLALPPVARAEEVEDGLPQPVPAPEIATPGQWLNSPPLTLKDLKGKVTLVDFWTYSCINCLRTLPYIKAWYQQYHDKGFTVIGIHAPEFDFEKDKANVEKAVKRFGILYPVVQDNDHLLWDRFSNRYWPAHYLVNKEGQIVYAHFGEGNYDLTERNIRALLDEHGPKAKVGGDSGGSAFLQTPETYLGTMRAERYVLNSAAQPDEYAYASHLGAHEWSLSGAWKRGPENIEALKPGAGLRLQFRGGKVFLVLGTANGQPVHASVFYNGSPATEKAGKDVKDGHLTVQEHRLYELLDLQENSGGLLEIKADDAGLEAYAFTFGGS